MPGEEIGELRAALLSWEESIRGDSAMCSRLAISVAADPEILVLLRQVPAGQLPMNMLLAAVQYILFEERDHPLAAWYPSLGGTDTSPGLEVEFAAFVRDNRSAIGELIATRKVQTNEVGRCTFLLPAYRLVNIMTGRPLAVIEVGTSAGLNQNFDRYGYRYTSTNGSVALEEGSIVQLECATGTRVLLAVDSVPSVEWRAGLDLNPINVLVPDEARWLRSLIWPDQPDRHARLAAAIQIALTRPPKLVAGNLLDALPQLVADAANDAALVIQHSFVLNQLPNRERQRFFAMLDDLAADRSVYRVGAEWLDADRGTILDLTIHGPNRLTRKLASVHHHGAWIDWFD